MQQLLYPSWQLTTVAKNLYTALLVLDASTDEALNAIYVAHAMLRQGYPVRVAFVLGDASLSDEASGDVFSDEVQDVDEAAGHRGLQYAPGVPSGPRSPPRVRWRSSRGVRRRRGPF